GDGVDRETVTQPNETVTTVTKTVTRKPLKRKARDGRDGRDGVAGPVSPKSAPNIEHTRAPDEPHQNDISWTADAHLDIPPLLDRRPKPRQDGRWAGTYVSDDDDAFIASGKFK